MKKCTDCNVEMIDGFDVSVDQNFEVGANAHSTINIFKPTGETTKSFLGIKLKKTIGGYISKASVCPKCGKVDFYINPEDLNK